MAVPDVFCKETMCVTFRGTHISYLNDLTEGVLLPKVLSKLGYDTNLLSVCSSLEGYPFVISLSSLEDDLNMWRNYADNGKGVCIGLLTAELPRKVLSQCHYVTEEELYNYVRRTYPNLNPKSDDITELLHILSDAVGYKDKNYEKESEWRLIFKDLPSGVSFNSSVLKPFYEYRFPLAAIKSISFGPKNDKRNEFALKSLLKVKGFPYENIIEFNHSQIPLR